MVLDPPLRDDNAVWERRVSEESFANFWTLLKLEIVPKWRSSGYKDTYSRVFFWFFRRSGNMRNYFAQNELRRGFSSRETVPHLKNYIRRREHWIKILSSIRSVSTGLELIIRLDVFLKLQQTLIFWIEWELLIPISNGFFYHNIVKFP